MGPPGSPWQAFGPAVQQGVLYQKRGWLSMKKYIYLGNVLKQKARSHEGGMRRTKLERRKLVGCVARFESDLARAREPHRGRRARRDPARAVEGEAPRARGHHVNAPTMQRLDPDMLLAMWLRDRIAELRRDAAKARRAYSRGRMAEIAERLAACHDKAASAYEDELAAITAPASRTEGR